MRRSQLPPHRTATFVLPQWKIVHVAIPKAASTSIKWLLADLQGEDQKRFHRTLSGETVRHMTIHRRTRWRHTPMLHQLTDSQLEEISQENGWFIFATVRHPFDRLWSAWQSKLLLREPPFINRYPTAPWPRVPASSSDVVEDFQAFALDLGKSDDAPLSNDRHFLPQTSLLSLETVPYSRIYRTTEVRSLLDELERHLRPLGLKQMPDLVRHNETPLPPIAALFDEATTEAISRYYTSDIERFGFTGSSTKPLPNYDYSADQIAHLRSLIERAERALDLFTFASSLHQRKQAVEEEVQSLRTRVTELEASSSPRRLDPRLRSLRRLRRFRDITASTS